MSRGDNIPTPEKGRGIFAWEEAEKLRLIRRVVRGPYVAETPDGYSIRVAPHAPPLFFYARILASVSIGNNQFSYTMQEVEKTDTGYGASKWTLTGDTFSALNLTEDMNTTSGTCGNGLVMGTSGDPPATIALLPAPVGLVRKTAHVITYQSASTAGAIDEYLFEYENAVSVTCTEE